MGQKKYTDEEIIKGLQVCSSNGDCNECPINPHKGNYGFCTSLAIKAALDLISRQKAEIERLTLMEREAHNQLEKGNTRMNAIIKAEIEEFADELRKGRVSNDPVVIAVNAELNMRWGADDERKAD